MSDQVMRLLAFAALLGFLGILLWRVPRIDLGMVVLITVACAGYDLFLYRRPR